MNNECGHWLNCARHTRSPNERTMEMASGAMLWHIPTVQISQQWLWPLRRSSGTAQKDNNKLTTASSISLLIHLSPSSPILMWTIKAILTMVSPLEVMWSRLGLERSPGVPSCNPWLPCPPLKQSTSLLLRLARRSCEGASSWGSLGTVPLDPQCSEWTISPPLQ